MSKTNNILIYNIVTLVLFALFSISAVAENIHVQVKGIDETRSTNELLRKTNIDLKISGKGLEGAEGVLPVTIKKAYCDSGTQLKSRIQPSEAYLYSFARLTDSLVIDQTVYLTSAKRSDKKILLEGEIKVYTPQPSSIITLNDFGRYSSQKNNHGSLRENGINLLFLTKTEYKNLISEAAEVKKDAKSNQVNLHDALFEHFGEEITYLIENYQRIYQGAYYDIYSVISGNWERVVNIEFYDESGSLIKNPDRGLMQGPDLMLCLFDFNDPPPTGKIVVQIMQEGDIVIHPFKTSAKLP